MVTDPIVPVSRGRVAVGPAHSHLFNDVIQLSNQSISSVCRIDVLIDSLKMVRDTECTHLAEASFT